jgi:two-component system alkaline phosphatase synthesis response regulator PhoP
MANIVLCDDEPHILKAAEYKFRSAGHNVRTAGDGEEGWQLIQESLPDLVITDYQMPRLNGLDLIARFRETGETAELPVILLTAKGFELSFQELHSRLRIFALIGKPFSPRELLAKAEEALAMQREPAGIAN